MLRKLLIITCLMSTVLIAFGQKKKKVKVKANKESATTLADVNYKEIGAPLPTIRMVTEKGKEYTEKDVENKANLFVMLFNPMCDHCQDETRLIQEHIALFQKSNILLMASPNMKEYLEFFENSTKVSKYPQIKVGLDSAKFIDKTFRYLELPQINIYDKDRKLLRMFNGHTPIDSLKSFIE